MKFNDWKIKVSFHEVEYDSIVAERHEILLMEQTLDYLINVCDFMPRHGDIIHDQEGFDEENPFEVLEVIFKLSTKTIRFILSTPSEDED